MDIQKVLIADDEKHIREILKMYCEKEGFDVIEAADGAEAILKVQSEKPDILILDIMMPVMDGLEVCKQVRKMSDLPIIMLTAKDEDDDRILGLEIGADDYITKPFGMMEFVARVKAVLRRCSRQEEDKELKCDDLRLSVGRHKVYWKEEKVELTRKEFELLQYLMENKGLVMTRNQILCHVWGYDFDGETRTVDVHVRTLRQKLGEAGNLIETVRGVGYRIGA